MTIAVRMLLLAALLVLLRLPMAVADPAIPPLTGRVVDLADVLTNAAERDLTNQLKKVEEKTGAQIVVATLPRLGQYPIDSWGLALGRGWQIGHKGKDDGIVIVLAPNDREVRIEVGYGLEGRVPDATAHKIIQSYMLPAAREGRYATGLEATIAALERVIIDPTAPLGAAPTGDSISAILLVIVLGVFVIVILFLALYDFGAWGSRESNRDRSDEQPDPLSHDAYDNRGSGFSASGSGSSHSSSFGGGGSSFSGRGGSFGGGGATGKW